MERVNNGMRANKVLFKRCAYTSTHIVLFLASQSKKEFRVLSVNKLASLFLKAILLYFNFSVGSQNMRFRHQHGRLCAKTSMFS